MYVPHINIQEALIIISRTKIKIKQQRFSVFYKFCSRTKVKNTFAERLLYFLAYYRRVKTTQEGKNEVVIRSPFEINELN